MEFTDRQYIIGIDLGTTNCAVSYVDVAAFQDHRESSSQKTEKKRWIKVFHVPQLTGQGEISKSEVLPSFLYIPGQYDISRDVLKHPWKKSSDLFAGSFARDHGAKVPSRLVSSAKSWLCNPKADRQSRILPWGSENIDKVSPVTAVSQYLEHIQKAWNHWVKDEDKFLENQFVVITVPASFNEEARQLTTDAVKMAGFGSAVTLLEEPLAAFYAWLIQHENNWQQHVTPGDLILICDVGGGTTDFSLITLKASSGSPRFERIAVGDHLMLGGDNIDLALAEKVASRFKSKKPLSTDKRKTLCYKCREAKEKILDQGKPSVRITLRGEGRSLIAGTLAADLSREDVEALLLDEFYPYVGPDTDLNQDIGREITDFGLPLEKESAVTHHILRFLKHHENDVQKTVSKAPLPDFILFNGGTLKPEIVQQRIKEAIGNYFDTDPLNHPEILENQSPELAVGIGASYYGMVKQGLGVKVGSGSPRSYYIGVTDTDQDVSKAVCLVERGLDEGSVIDLTQMAYEVIANEPVRFDIYSSSYRSGDTAGKTISIDESLTAMTPLQTMIKFGKKGGKKKIPVTIAAEYSEMGTLSMFCHSKITDHRWQLSFQLRDSIKENLELKETTILDDDLISDCCDHVETVFMDTSMPNDALKGVVKQLEKLAGHKKAGWPVSFLRRLADKLIELEDVRKISDVHEAKWLNLTGFCMRPGFGDGFDEVRLKKIWKIYLSGLTFEKQQQNRLEWWIFIRRIAAGLKAGQQRQFFQHVASDLIKGKGSKVNLPPQEYIELWMATGNMERLLIKDKLALGKALLPKLKSGRKQDRLFWTLSRLGARELLYGSVDRVISPQEVIKWINQIMKKKWINSDPVENLVAQMSRKTGDRTRDIDPESRENVLKWLESRKAAGNLHKMVIEKTEVMAREQNVQFGERLPSGLILKTQSTE